MAYKIIVGIPSNIPLTSILAEAVNKNGVIEDFEVIDDEVDIWNDFEVVYNYDSKKYYIDFETMLAFKEKDGCRNWIIHCLSVFTDYMKEHNYDILTELSMYTVFTDGVNCNTGFECLEDAYAFMKIMVFGFHGKGIGG